MKSEYLKRWMLYLEEIGKPAEDGTRDGKNDGELGKPVMQEGASESATENLGATFLSDEDTSGITAHSTLGLQEVKDGVKVGRRIPVKRFKRNEPLTFEGFKKRIIDQATAICSAVQKFFEPHRS